MEGVDVLTVVVAATVGVDCRSRGREDADHARE